MLLILKVYRGQKIRAKGGLYYLGSKVWALSRHSKLIPTWKIETLISRALLVPSDPFLQSQKFQLGGQCVVFSHHYLNHIFYIFT